MAEQTLIDYIKKARVAGQADSQSRELLLKNGWTQAEADDAFASLSQAAITPQQQPKPEPEPKLEPEPELEPEVQAQPQVQVRPASQQSQLQAQIQQNMPRMKNPSHKIVSILMVLIIVAILGGAGLFVAGQYLNINIPFNPFGADPKIVIGKMQENMKATKAFKSVIAVEVSTLDSDKSSLGKLTINATSNIDSINASNIKASSDLLMQITMTGADTPIAIVGANIIMLGDVVYLKLNDVTVPESIPLSATDLLAIKGKFLKIDNDSVKTLAVNQETSIPDFSDAKNLIPMNNLLAFKKNMGSEKIGSVDTYHYLLTINKDSLKNFLEKIMASQKQTLPDGQDSEIGSLYQEMAQSMILGLADALGDVDVQVWIGKKDSMLYRFNVDKMLALDELLGVASLNNISIKVNAVYSDFNKPLVIQTPVEAQKIEDFLLPIVKIQKIKSDMTFISDLAETIFLENNDSYTSLCYKGLLNGYNKDYGASLISLNSSITEQGGKKPVCFASASGFCISTQQADGSWICTDEEQNIGTTKCLSSATDCQ